MNVSLSIGTWPRVLGRMWRRLAGDRRLEMVETSMSLKAIKRRSAMRRCLDFVVVVAAAAAATATVAEGGWVVEGMPFEWGAELTDIAIVYSFVGRIDRRALLLMLLSSSAMLIVIFVVSREGNSWYI